MTEITEALSRPVVVALRRLITLRNEYVAFTGQFSLRDSDASTLCLHWQHSLHSAELRVDFKDLRYRLTVSEGEGGLREVRLID